MSQFGMILFYSTLLSSFLILFKQYNIRPVFWWNLLYLTCLMIPKINNNQKHNTHNTFSCKVHYANIICYNIFRICLLFMLININLIHGFMQCHMILSKMTWIHQMTQQYLFTRRRSHSSLMVRFEIILWFCEIFTLPTCCYYYFTCLKLHYWTISISEYFVLSCNNTM